MTITKTIKYKFLNTYRNLKYQYIHYKRVKFQTKMNNLFIKMGSPETVRIIF